MRISVNFVNEGYKVVSFLLNYTFNYTVEKKTPTEKNKHVLKDK